MSLNIIYICCNGDNIVVYYSLLYNYTRLNCTSNKILTFCLQLAISIFAEFYALRKRPFYWYRFISCIKLILLDFMELSSGERGIISDIAKRIILQIPLSQDTLPTIRLSYLFLAPYNINNRVAAIVTISLYIL